MGGSEWRSHRCQESSWSTAAHPGSIIAAMSEADYAMLMEEFMIDGVKPTPVQRTTAALLGSACRVMWGTQRRLADIRSRRIKMQSRHMSWSWQRHLYHQ